MICLLLKFLRRYSFKARRCNFVIQVCGNIVSLCLTGDMDFINKRLGQHVGFVMIATNVVSGSTTQKRVNKAHLKTSRSSKSMQKKSTSKKSEGNFYHK